MASHDHITSAWHQARRQRRRPEVSTSALNLIALSLWENLTEDQQRGAVLRLREEAFAMIGDGVVVSMNRLRLRREMPEYEAAQVRRGQEIVAWLEYELEEGDLS